MDLESGQNWSHGGLDLIGLSLSGIRTAFVLPQLHIGFDVAQGLPFSMAAKKFFISHGHLDHAGGIPYIISQKAMHNEAPPQFFMPESLVSPLKKIIELWSEIEGHPYPCHFQAVSEFWQDELSAQHLVRAFRTSHRIQSYGYTLFQRNKKLKPEFLGKPEEELVRLKQTGIEIQNLSETPLLSFTGDTQIEFLINADVVKKSKVLICETTYLDQRKSVEHAKKWGHTHLDELIAHLDEIAAEKILLIHVSSRYSTKEALSLLRQRIPARHQDRVELFLGR